MASTGTYLNFDGNAEEALNFYIKVFDTELMDITRYGDFGDGGDEGDGPGIPEDAKNLLMNAQILILGGHLLQVSDHVESFGMGALTQGNNVSIVLMTDSQQETNELYDKLMEGREKRIPPQDMGFGYYAEGADKFGINWMFYNTLEG